MFSSWAGTCTAIGTASPQKPHIISLPFVRWNGPTTPTFLPRQQPLQASCIDHLTLWDPKHLTHQIGNTQTIPSVFLDHHGVLGRISLPILTSAAIAHPPIPTASKGTYIPVPHPGTYPRRMEIQSRGGFLHVHHDCTGHRLLSNGLNRVSNRTYLTGG
jgi:hypothetical protein